MASHISLKPEKIGPCEAEDLAVIVAEIVWRRSLAVPFGLTVGGAGELGVLHFAAQAAGLSRAGPCLVGPSGAASKRGWPKHRAATFHTGVRPANAAAYAEKGHPP